MNGVFKRYIKLMWPWMVMGLIPWAIIGWTILIKLVGFGVQLIGITMIIHKGNGEWPRAEQALRDEVVREDVKR